MRSNFAFAFNESHFFPTVATFFMFPECIFFPVPVYICDYGFLPAKCSVNLTVCNMYAFCRPVGKFERKLVSVCVP